MDQNTNNSFTSAPQGGDYSDIIIPNAYTTKPKGKNLKKYVVFGVIGLVALFLVGLIAKAIFIDSRTMSKQEVVALVNSNDMQAVDIMESQLYQIYRGGYSLLDIMDDSMHKNILNGVNAVTRIKVITDKKNKATGNRNLKDDYSFFVDSLNKRYDKYISAINIYEDFYKAIKDLNPEPLRKYTSNIDEVGYSIVSKNIIELIEENIKLKSSIDNGSCQLEDGQIFGTNTCKTLSDNATLKLDEINNSNEAKNIFHNVYNIDNYEKIKNLKYILSDYIEKKEYKNETKNI